MNRRQRNIEKVISFLRSYDPQKIILFGSQARGDDDKYSDLDLVVAKILMNVSLIGWRPFTIWWNQTSLQEVPVYAPQELADMRDRGNAFIEDVLKEGVVLYERSEE